MSQLTKDVYDNLKCQNGTSCWGDDGGISVAFRTLSIHIVADWLMNVNVFIDAYIFSKCSPMLSVGQSKSIAIVFMSVYIVLIRDFLLHFKQCLFINLL